MGTTEAGYAVILEAKDEIECVLDVLNELHLCSETFQEDKPVPAALLHSFFGGAGIIINVDLINFELVAQHGISLLVSQQHNGRIAMHFEQYQPPRKDNA